MKLTRQKAIDAKCKDCSFDEKDTGTWRMQVERCADKTCPLWEYRPLPDYRKSRSADEGTC